MFAPMEKRPLGGPCWKMCIDFFFFFLKLKFYRAQARSLHCHCHSLYLLTKAGDLSYFLHGFVKVFSWICQSCYMNSSVWHGFLKLYITLCQTKPSWSFTKIVKLLNASGSAVELNWLPWFKDFFQSWLLQIFSANGKTATWRPNLEDVHLFAPQTNFRKT